MGNILVIFSLVLHGVSFIAIFWLYQKVQALSEGERQFDKRTQEVEDIFSSYLLEIKDENKKFTEQIKSVNGESSVNRKHTEHSLNKGKQKEESEIQTNEYLAEEELPKPAVNHPSNEHKYQPDQLAVEDKIEQPSFQSMVLQLYNSGHTVESIAKQLDRGKTEVELIVKFNQ
ncbi:hypothetical protein CEY16_02510 [Halalkalibacillus sediminis]|uniref:Swarming motility protein SwrB n=1 Tax=Halalkalibacillus sediminis TaxID=2018042 RepID=A0A2I0QWF7_9BACI|nr:hypothetical protein [Halalkalibacillus sediminis]PKR78648.1 hypothetical protein CEY16_02510 [Halalkalibacillus sediminis]